MRLAVCKGCGEEFDVHAYGTGFKWCSAKCKHTHGGLKDIAYWKGGRPSRFPPVNETEREKIVAELESHGWKISHYEDAEYGRFEELLLIQRGMSKPIRAAIGNGFHLRWAHVVLFPDPTGKTMVKSNCNKKLHNAPIVETYNWHRPGHKFYREPCDSPRCVKCAAAREVRTIGAVVDRLAQDRKLPSDEQSETTREGAQGA